MSNKQGVYKMENKKNIVTLHNNFIEAIYSLSVDAKKLLLSTFLHLDRDNGEINIHREDLLKEIGIDPRKYRKEHLKNIFKELMTKVIEIKDINNESHWILLQLLKKTEYSNGYFKTSIYPELLPYFEEAQKRLFTRFSIQNIKPLTSIYAIRIYELCKMFIKEKSVKEISIEELKKILQIEDKYKQISDFKKRVLETAKKQINKNTDLEIDYELTKEGRKYTKVRFLVTQHLSLRSKIENQKIDKSHLRMELLKHYKGKQIKPKYAPSELTWVITDIIIDQNDYATVQVSDNHREVGLILPLSKLFHIVYK